MIYVSSRRKHQQQFANESWPEILFSYETKSFAFLDTRPALPPYTAVLRVQDQTEAGFVPRHENSNQRLLATGLKLVKPLQSESFCGVITKYFFLLQKKGKSFTDLVKSFLRNLSSSCNKMFEEWIYVRSEMTAGRYVQHGLLNSSLCRLFKDPVPCGFQIKIPDGILNL